jgi:hypothetical protein
MSITLDPSLWEDAREVQKEQRIDNPFEDQLREMLGREIAGGAVMYVLSRRPAPGTSPNFTPLGLLSLPLGLVLGLVYRKSGSPSIGAAGAGWGWSFWQYFLSIGL